MSGTVENILFEKFEIISCMKKDEFSSVYLANHIFLEKRIILKVLDTSVIQNENLNQRFKREARILASLDHPNIIKVLDFGTSGKYFYISFEYFKSVTLREIINSGEKNTERIKDLFVQFYKGLEYIHSKGIIHRDIKPENVLVDDNYSVKLSDFGLAVSATDKFITGKLDLVGTPCYMSPEQILGEKLTVRSDLFSAGIMLLETLTGKNPFLGENINKSINSIINFNEAEIGSRIEKTGVIFQNILRDSLRKKSTDRIDSAGLILKYLGYEEEKTKINTIKKKNKKIVYILFLAVPLVLLFVYFEFANGTSSKTNYEKKEKLSGKINEPGKPEKVAGDRKDEFSKPAEEIKNNITLNKKYVPGSTEKYNKPAIAADGLLDVKCIPWGVVYIDSVKTETTPFASPVSVKSGIRSIKIIHPDYPEFNGKIKIVSDSLSRININLEDLVGFFHCNVFPWGFLEIDGKSYGQTPLQNPVHLSPGKHYLVLKNSSFGEISDTIFVERQDTLNKNYRFN